jgi:hypothetical protein
VLTNAVLPSATFRRLNPNYAFAQPVPTSIEQPQDADWMGAHQYLNTDATQPPQLLAATQGEHSSIALLSTRTDRS